MRDYTKDFKTEQLEFKVGLYNYFGDKQSSFGFTLILNHVTSKTYLTLEDLDEAIETCESHFNEWDKIKLRAADEIKYCIDNPWTRSGT